MTEIPRLWKTALGLLDNVAGNVGDSYILLVDRGFHPESGLLTEARDLTQCLE